MSIYMNFNNKLKTVLFLALTIFAPAVWAHGHGESHETPGSAAKIGGDFTLIDQHGKMAKDADFHGKVMLVFFGYTHCPDICPVSVDVLSKAMGMLGAKADQVVPIFITVDPQRDTSVTLKDYLANFDKRIIALTGKPVEIKKAADAYKVYFSIAEASKQKNGDYMVDHSTIIYMMGKDGSYLRHFSYNAAPQEIVDGILEVLK